MPITGVAIQPESLSLRFHKTEISKRYVCLVHGRVSQAKGLVDANIRTLRTDATTRREEMSSGSLVSTSFSTDFF
jgi:23S rRNA-/tRNA-specific pseudouridylate synthase